MNSARPLAPVAALTASVQRFQVEASQGAAGSASAALATSAQVRDHRLHRPCDDGPPLHRIGDAREVRAHGEPERLAAADRERRETILDLVEGEVVDEPRVQMLELGLVELRRGARDMREVDKARELVERRAPAAPPRPSRRARRATPPPAARARPRAGPSATGGRGASTAPRRSPSSGGCGARRPARRRRAPRRSGSARRCW